MTLTQIKKAFKKCNFRRKENFGSFYFTNFLRLKNSFNKKSTLIKISRKFLRKFHNSNFIFCIIKIVAITTQ